MEHGDRRRSFGFRLTLLLVTVSIVPQLYGQEQDAVEDSLGLKSTSLALTISLITTAIPMALAAGVERGHNEANWLVGTGLIFGPAAGYVYSGAWGRALTGVAIRLGTAMGAMLIGSRDWRQGNRSSAMIGAAGLAAVIGEAVYDLVVVGPYVNEMNSLKKESARRPGVIMNLSPMYKTKSRSVGLRVIIAF